MRSKVLQSQTLIHIQQDKRFTFQNTDIRCIVHQIWTFVIILLSAGFEKLFLLLLDCVTRAVTGEVPQC